MFTFIGMTDRTDLSILPQFSVGTGIVIYIWTLNEFSNFVLLLLDITGSYSFFIPAWSLNYTRAAAFSVFGFLGTLIN